MKTYKLIKKTTNEEHICTKVTIDGFDYYISSKNPDKSYEGFYLLDNEIFHTSKIMLQTGCNDVIATNNPNIDIPKIIYEVDGFAKEATKIYVNEREKQTVFLEFINGYNKSKETNIFSEEDMISFSEFAGNYYANLHNSVVKPHKLLQLWKEQRVETIYY